MCTLDCSAASATRVPGERASLASIAESQPSPPAPAPAVPTAAPAANPNASLLDNAEQAENTLLTLLGKDTDSLISYRGGPAKELVAYAHRWLKLVGEEFRDEVTEGLLKRPRGIECTISVLGPVKDSSRGAQWLTVKIKENKSEDEEAAPDPTAMHMLWLSAEFGVVFYISGYQPDRRDAAETPPRCGRDAVEMRPRCGRAASEMRDARGAAAMHPRGCRQHTAQPRADELSEGAGASLLPLHRRGDKFRAITFDAEALRHGRAVPPRDLPRVKARCVELASASTTLQRVHALCSIGKR